MALLRLTASWYRFEEEQQKVARWPVVSAIAVMIPHTDQNQSPVALRRIKIE